MSCVQSVLTCVGMLVMRVTSVFPIGDVHISVSDGANRAWCASTCASLTFALCTLRLQVLRLVVRAALVEYTGVVCVRRSDEVMK